MFTVKSIKIAVFSKPFVSISGLLSEVFVTKLCSVLFHFAMLNFVSTRVLKK